MYRTDYPQQINSRIFLATRKTKLNRKKKKKNYMKWVSTCILLCYEFKPSATSILLFLSLWFYQKNYERRLKLQFSLPRYFLIIIVQWISYKRKEWKEKQKIIHNILRVELIIRANYILTWIFVMTFLKWNAKIVK